jgi:transglutaminase-like putative cysteine protease
MTDVRSETVRSEQQTRCRIIHRFRYTYDGPVSNVHQRLLVVPPRRLGPQRLRAASVEVSLNHTLRWCRDAHGNTVASVRVPRVEESVEFVTTVEVDRDRADEVLLPSQVFHDRYWRQATRLTDATATMERTARALTAGATEPEAAADEISRFVHRSIAYRHGATEVSTTATEALEIGAGVCQDHAHAMVALCRAVDLPARYVSGHLLGEGATHAWVEVLTPTAHGTRVVAFDPCNDRRPNANYVTVAIGRDYRDVAPTSGTYEGCYAGRLTASKIVEVLD